jgi:hypothetical protein
MSNIQGSGEGADRGTWQTAIPAWSGKEEPTLVSPPPYQEPGVASATQIVPVYMPEGSYRQTSRLSGVSRSGGRTDAAKDGWIDHVDAHGRREDEIEGETFRTVFGNLLGVYTWECDRVPAIDEVQVAMEHRVQTDCGRLNRRPKDTRLAGWHGGWTTEGLGIFAADIWGVPRKGPGRHLGRVSLVVRTPVDTGMCVSQGIAC